MRVVPEAVVIEKDMALTRADFHRGIVRALGSDAFEGTADGVVLEDARGRLEITLGPERTRRIALLSVPAMAVRLIFTGYADADRAAALAAFDRAFQRGGG